MAWNATTILNRAKEFVRTYADEDRVTSDDVRAAFEEFALNTRAFHGSESFSTVANQRVYNLARIFEVVRVRYNNNEIPLGYQSGVQSYQVRPSQVVLNFDPPANVNLVVEGYEVPANINSVNLQPETAWMDCIAHYAAARVLRRYGDAQAVQRSREFEAQASALAQDLFRRLIQPHAPRPNSTDWNTAYIVHRARELLHPYGLSALATDAEAVHMVMDFLAETQAHRTSTLHTTVANQKRYSLGRVLQVETVKYDGEEIPQGDAPNSQSYRVDSELILNFEPDAGKPLIIEGRGLPATVSEVKLEPTATLMDAIAYRLVAELLLRSSKEREAIARAQLLLSRYNDAVRLVRRQVAQMPKERGGRPIRPRPISIV